METQKIQTDHLKSPSTGYLIPLGKTALQPISVGDFFNIGRAPINQLVIADSYVSSRHARIEKRANGFVLRDLNSRNGTFLNGSAVTEAVLASADKIRFGETTFTFTESQPNPLELNSKNLQWNEQLQRIPAFASTNFPVLLLGESGTGKEVLAQEIHRQSHRSKEPFISINCSALSEHLIESELFGHLKGSFTGAFNDRRGAFEAARGGTLFLDEIGDLPLHLQPKILRALENNEIRPLGSDRTIVTDVRIVAATNKNLEQLVLSGDFREDLYYRLHVCRLTPPPLLQRMEDFDTLIYQFCKQFKVRMSFHAIELLRKQNWPGNIRQLKNMVAQISAYYPGLNVQVEQVQMLLNHETFRDRPQPVIAVTAPENMTKKNLVKEFERDLILKTLKANRGNQRKTASELGIPKSTLHDRIKDFSIDVKELMA